MTGPTIPLTTSGIFRVKQLLSAALTALAAAGAAPAPALADDNRIYLLQVAPDAGRSNTIFVDQSRATGSLVHGLSEALVPPDAAVTGTPGVQYGGDNSLEIDVRGQGNEVQLAQQGLPVDGTLFPGFGNTAAIFAPGTDQLAILGQLGDGNSAEITLRRDIGSTGELYQFGDRNTATLTVRGDGTRGVLIQEGTNLDSALTVRARGADVQYRLNGSNVSAPGGVVVVTNIGQGAPITITQSQ